MAKGAAVSGARQGLYGAVLGVGASSVTPMNKNTGLMTGGVLGAAKGIWDGLWGDP